MGTVRGLAGSNHDTTQDERSASAGGEAIGLLEQKLRHAAADGAAADQRDVKRFRHEPSVLAAEVRKRGLSAARSRKSIYYQSPCS